MQQHCLDVPSIFRYAPASNTTALALIFNGMILLLTETRLHLDLVYCEIMFTSTRQASKRTG